MCRYLVRILLQSPVDFFDVSWTRQGFRWASDPWMEYRLYKERFIYYIILLIMPKEMGMLDAMNKLTFSIIACRIVWPVSHRIVLRGITTEFQFIRHGEIFSLYKCIPRCYRTKYVSECAMAAIDIESIDWIFLTSE